MGILLRTLTKKSTLGFGKYKSYTVAEMLKTSFKMKENLISSYYKIQHINYTVDILNELGITGDWIIPKPSIDLDKYYEFIKTESKRDSKMFGIKTAEKLNKMKNFGKYKTEVYTKTKMQSYNQNKR